MLRHHFSWKRASMAAVLCHAIGGGGAPGWPFIQAGRYDRDSLIGVLKGATPLLGGQKATLAWDG